METITIIVVYALQLSFLLVNCYLFLYRQKEYKNIHSINFYLLSIIITAARIADLSFSMQCYRKDNKNEASKEHFGLIRAVNLANFTAVYGKILLGWATFVSVMCLVDELARFNNPGVKTIEKSASGRSKLAKQISIVFAGIACLITITICIVLVTHEFQIDDRTEQEKSLGDFGWTQSVLLIMLIIALIAAYCMLTREVKRSYQIDSDSNLR